MTRSRRPLRAIVRFLAAVLMVSGALLVLDAVATLVWQEPVSWAIASIRQSELEAQLEGAGDPFGGDLEAAAKAWEKRVGRGEPLGRIRLPTVRRSYVMVQGVGTASLRKGPGHYSDTSLPGERGTVAVAGHRTTYLAPFRTIDKLRRGDRVTVEMPYGRFVYAVEGTRVVAPTDVEVIRDIGRPRLVLTACHPLYSAAQRIVAFGRLVRAEPLWAGGKR